MPPTSTRIAVVASPGAASALLPEDPSEFDLEWLGLVGFADPLRAAVPDAVAEARAAGDTCPFGAIQTR